MTRHTTIEVESTVYELNKNVGLLMNPEAFQLILDLVSAQELKANEGDTTFRSRGLTTLHHRLLQANYKLAKELKK